MKRIIRSRIRELNDGLLNNPAICAIGHVFVASLVAGTIAFLTAQTNKVVWLADSRAMWYVATVVFPLTLSAIVSTTWHIFGAPWLQEIALRGWVLHTFFNPQRTAVGLTLPSPETYLVIASAAGAGAVIALDTFPWVTTTISATLVGSLTAAAIVLSSPNVGAVATRRRLYWQTEEFYRRLLDNKKQTQARVIRKQRYLCADCSANIRYDTRRFALIRQNLSFQGSLTEHDIKAVCNRCSLNQPTTGAIKEQ